MKKLLLCITLVAATALAGAATAQTGYFCDPEPRADGWTRCFDSNGKQLDCMIIGDAYFCIQHQDWHDHPS